MYDELTESYRESESWLLRRANSCLALLCMASIGQKDTFSSVNFHLDAHVHEISARPYSALFTLYDVPCIYRWCLGRVRIVSLCIVPRTLYHTLYASWLCFITTLTLAPWSHRLTAPTAMADCSNPLTPCPGGLGLKSQGLPHQNKQSQLLPHHVPHHENHKTSFDEDSFCWTIQCIVNLRVPNFWDFQAIPLLSRIYWKWCLVVIFASRRLRFGKRSNSQLLIIWSPPEHHDASWKISWSLPTETSDYKIFMQFFSKFPTSYSWM